MPAGVRRSIIGMAVLAVVLVSTGCGDDRVAHGDLSCPDGQFGSVGLGDTDSEQGRPMASDVLPDIAFHTGIPVAAWESDQYGKDRATWVLRDGDDVVAVAEAVHGDLGWRAGTVESCGQLRGPAVP